jgi:hypothetical protein
MFGPEFRVSIFEFRVFKPRLFEVSFVSPNSRSGKLLSCTGELEASDVARPGDLVVKARGQKWPSGLFSPLSAARWTGSGGIVRHRKLLSGLPPSTAYGGDRRRSPSVGITP